MSSLMFAFLLWVFKCVSSYFKTENNSYLWNLFYKNHLIPSFLSPVSKFIIRIHSQRMRNSEFSFVMYPSLISFLSSLFYKYYCQVRLSTKRLRQASRYNLKYDGPILWVELFYTKCVEFRRWEHNLFFIATGGGPHFCKNLCSSQTPWKDYELNLSTSYYTNKCVFSTCLTIGIFKI